MMCFDTARRVTAADALAHRYFTIDPLPTPADQLPRPHRAAAQGQEVGGGGGGGGGGMRVVMVVVRGRAGTRTHTLSTPVGFFVPDRAAWAARPPLPTRLRSFAGRPTQAGARWRQASSDGQRRGRGGGRGPPGGAGRRGRGIPEETPPGIRPGIQRGWLRPWPLFEAASPEAAATCRPAAPANGGPPFRRLYLVAHRRPCSRVASTAAPRARCARARVITWRHAARAPPQRRRAPNTPSDPAPREAERGGQRTPHASAAGSAATSAAAALGSTSPTRRAVSSSASASALTP